ncbi:glycosyltransferase family 4 protein, partial [Escherichia coli]|uniref:glycosyltransferase family 4 protein n=2 Tax=Escherichia coli TaxID=562 RepID=UPI0011203CB0
IVILLAIIACIYGLLVPFLISMKDTVAVISGFALAFLTPPCIYAIYKGLSFTKDKR